MSQRPEILTATQAVGRIASGAGVAVPGNAFRLAPETLLAALEQRFLLTGTPRDLNLYYPMLIEVVRGTTGIPGTGLNRLAREGLVKRIVGGSFSRSPEQDINALVRANGVEAYNLPIGTIVNLFRAAARGERGVLTTTGLDTFADPRLGGGRLNERTTENLAEAIEFRGRELLHYPTPRIDVAIIRASFADERGNISFERDAFMLGSLHAAMAAKNAGGQVFVEVDDIVAAGTLDPRKVVIPGHMVSAIVRAEIPAVPEGAGDVGRSAAPAWAYSGERRAPMARPALQLNARTLIARRALREVQDGAVVNLGAGLPMYDVPMVARWEGAVPGQYRFSIEQGLFGGWPEAGGIAANPDAMLDMTNVFDYYAGGGIDVSILAFAEVDRDGSVNVSRFGRMMPGCGGFVEITQNTRHLVFCGMFSGGGEVRVESGRVTVQASGKFGKFVPQLQELTFNARARVNRAQTVTYITERAVLRREEDGLVVVELAPGIDLQRDVLEHLPFPVRVADRLTTMDAALFVPPVQEKT